MIRKDKYERNKCIFKNWKTYWINKNQSRRKKNIKDNIAEINGEYLYKLWKNSFQNLSVKEIRIQKILCIK